MKKTTLLTIYCAIFFVISAHAQLLSGALEGGLSGKGVNLSLNLGRFSARLGYNRSEQSIIQKNNLFKKPQQNLPIEGTKNSSLGYVFLEYGIPNIKLVGGLGYKTKTVFREIQVRSTQPIQTEGGDIFPTTSGVLTLQDKLKHPFMPYLGIKLTGSNKSRISISADIGSFLTAKKEYLSINSTDPIRDLRLLNTHESGYSFIQKINLIIGYRIN
jgi:hypothetical protein